LDEGGALRFAPRWLAGRELCLDGLVEASLVLDERSPGFNFDAEVRAPVLFAGWLDVSWRRAIEEFIFGFFVGLAGLSFTSTRETFRV
jgi:hypothetical protein